MCKAQVLYVRSNSKHYVLAIKIKLHESYKIQAALYISDENKPDHNQQYSFF